MCNTGKDNTIAAYILPPAADIFEDPRLSRIKCYRKQVDRRATDLHSNLAHLVTLENLRKADEYIDKRIAIAKIWWSPVAADALAYYMQKADTIKRMAMLESIDPAGIFTADGERANPNGTLSNSPPEHFTEYFDL